MSKLPPSKFQGVKDSDVCHTIQFAGLPERDLRLNVISELERLTRALRVADSESNLTMTMALAVRLEMLTVGMLDKLRVHHPSEDIEWHRELVASLEISDFVSDSKLGRERQIEYLHSIGLTQYVQVKIREPKTGSEQVLFLSRGKQADFLGNVYENLEQLPSFHRTVPRISRSLTG